MAQPELVVSDTLRGFKRGKKVVYAGKLANRLSTWSARLMPRDMILLDAASTSIMIPPPYQEVHFSVEIVRRPDWNHATCGIVEYLGPIRRYNLPRTRCLLRVSHLGSLGGTREQPGRGAKTGEGVILRCHMKTSTPRTASMAGPSGTDYLEE